MDALGVIGVPSPPGLGGVAGGITEAGVRAALSAITAWIAAGAAGLVRAVAGLIDRVVEPRLDSTWFLAHVQDMAAIAALLVVPLVVGAMFSAIVRQDARMLGRTVCVHLPVAGVLTALSVLLVQLALSVTDDLCSMVTHSRTIGAGPFLLDLGQRLQDAPHVAAANEFGVVIVAVVLALGAFGLAVELWMRSAAIYVAVLFLPLTIAGTIWPTTGRWARRLVELLAVLVLSKFVIVAIVTLGSSAIAAGLGAGDFSALIAGAALLLLAVFSPFTLLRLVPIVDSGAIGHLDGVGRRLAGPLDLTAHVPTTSDPNVGGVAAGTTTATVGLADYPLDSGPEPAGRATSTWAALRSGSAIAKAGAGNAAGDDGG
jgi:hypothetical protein